MTDFLLELLCEEIPARMQVKASDDLARLFTEQLSEAGLKADALQCFVTPRRLALIARGLPVETQAVREEHKGPRTSAPAQALEGFLRKTGLTQDQLVDRDGVWFAVIEKPGRPTAAVLAQAIPVIIRAFPWPKAMRWGAASQTTESLRWVRPLQGILALLGETPVAIEVDGITSGTTTRGHRFHHPAPVPIASAAAYVDALRAAHVIVDHAERMAIIEECARAAAATQGLTLIEDKGLVAENAGLTEWPVPLLGDFDPAFLEVPPEVIQLTLRTNQKYFVLRDGDGMLAPAFICTANIEAIDGGAAIVAGNRKVLAARLSDARFFWEQDKRMSLAEHAKKLERITFHEKLGTVADKVDRVAKLARWLVDTKIIKPAPGASETLLFNDVSTAARLCKADLVTEMVGEFPELQGIMGGYYARAEGLSDAVADAIRDHYKPVGQGDDVPTAPVTVAVSLADKLDSISSFFAINEKPTGSKDPFALRRSALGVIAVILTGELRLSLFEVFKSLALLTPATDAFEVFEKIYADGFQDDVTREEALSADESNLDRFARNLATQTFLFIIDRLKVQQREAGVRHDLIDAVFALGGEDDLVRLLARVKALQAFVETAEGANLLAGYKRAANILKKEAPDSARIPAKAGTQGNDALADEHDAGVPGGSGLLLSQENGLAKESSSEPEPAEAALIAALDAAEPRAKAAIEAEDFAGAMSALATLRAPIDAFFEGVTVNNPEPDKRAARLALLARMRDAVHGVADFSKIEG